jgi:glycosyltransferase involved in cell wall biosynthesis
LIYANGLGSIPIFEMVEIPDVPAILHVRELHMNLLPIMKMYPDLMVSRPARYLAVSNVVRDALMAECGIDRNRIIVVHVFIKERHLELVRRTHAGRPDNGTLVVGGSGSASWYKGTSLWLQMVSEFRRLAAPSARFIWVGVPDWPAPGWEDGLRFRREAQLMGLEDLVELIPSTPKALEHFAEFDIFAMTSWEDPCPRVVLENMGLGTPVVCFAGGGGAPEVVGDTGVIVPGFDARAMARVVAELAANPAERARLGTLARERMLANFTDRVQVPKIRREILALIRKQVPSLDQAAHRTPGRAPVGTVGQDEVGDRFP